MQKATVSFVMSVCQSFRRPHGTTGFPLVGFSLNSIFEYFLKAAEKMQSFIKISQE
jgi:hypothetical protein